VNATHGMSLHAVPRQSVTLAIDNECDEHLQ